MRLQVVSFPPVIVTRPEEAPDESELIKRITSHDPDEVMPEKSFNKSLTERQIAVVRKWIEQGAEWKGHWSYLAPVRPAEPAAEGPAGFVRNPIDKFVLAKLKEHNLSPSPEADKVTLIRRLSFDVTGLPPTPQEVKAFVEDTSTDAYEKLVDRLLASPAYGERMAEYWLDLVRYADTSGFETDHFFIAAWRYRDWVIESFNKDTPYTEFVQAQIAADEIWGTNLDHDGHSKMPAEKEQNLRRRIGTGLFTIGSFPIEYTYYGDQWRAEWAGDAVETVGSAFLGLTVGCARCHDHKFDPISHRDFYKMTALFAGSSEREIPVAVATWARENPRALRIVRSVAPRESP